jgi:hypothetical protein
VRFPRRLVIAVFLIVAAAARTCAVVPLVTDDADTVEAGKWQLNAGWLFTQSASEKLLASPVNLVTGLNSHAELGITFGYQRRDGAGAGPDKNDASGVTDILVGNKWRLWQAADEKLKIGARFDLKLPTAPGSRGLGTGDFDTAVTMIATRSVGNTDIDWNVGYVALDLAHRHARDDHWFFGQAIRRKINDRWTLIGEIFATVPNTGSGGSSNFHFSAGPQFTARENLVISALLGSEAGHHSPDLTGYLGVTVVY